MTEATRTLVDSKAERATLGACLIDPAQLVDVANIVDESAFYLDGNRYVYRAMLDLFEADKDIDLITLPSAVKAITNIKNVGNGTIRGEAYITALMTSDEVYSYSAVHYANIVADLAKRRELILGCQQAVKGALDLGTHLSDTIEVGAQTLLNISANGHRDIRPMSDDFDEYANLLRARIASPNKTTPGLSTGFVDIDSRTSGLEPGKVWVIAGRPGMGKTAWLIAMTWALSVEQDYRAAIFSLEMSRSELYKRMVAYKSKVNLQDLAKGELYGEDIEKVERALALLEPAKERIWIDQTGDLTPVQIRARATKAMIRGGLDYLWLDFLQLVRVPGAKGEMQGYIQATVAAREMKNLAKHLEIPIVVASQLSRRVEHKTDKRPELSHLRDSGAIEEAADLVGFLYREGYYPELQAIDPHLAEFIIAKHRDGPSNTSAYLYWNPECAGYYNAETRDIYL